MCIRDRLTHEIIELDDEDMSVDFYKDGKEIALDAVKDMNVLNICESMDGMRIAIEVSDKKVVGTVSSLSEDGAVINDVEYDVYTGINKPLSVGTVSYTHLDVYKRQMYGGLCHAMYIGLPNGTISNNTAAISYTHLDVYKRQVLKKSEPLCFVLRSISVHHTV